MVPLAPLVVIFAAALIHELARRRYARAGSIAATLVVLAAAAPALWASVMINGPAREDPRTLIPPIVANAQARVAFDRYTSYELADILGLAEPPPTAATADIVSTASFTYERFAHYGDAAGQPPEIRTAARYYAALPHLDVTNGRPAFAFFNPALRIVALILRCGSWRWMGVPNA
jgi:hypothetical protein